MADGTSIQCPHDLIGAILLNGYRQQIHVLAVHEELTLVHHPELGGCYVTHTHLVMKFEVVDRLPEDKRQALLPAWYKEAVRQIQSTTLSANAR